MLRELGTQVATAIRNVVMNQVASSIIVPGIVRMGIYRLCGAQVMTRWIAPRCFLGGPNIAIGQGTFINYECFLDDFASITIGTDCNLAMRVLVLTSTHDIGSTGKRGAGLVGKPVVIGNGCWIGAGVTVMPGITIGEGCIIAAAALVSEDCPANGLYAGIPARRIRELD